MIQSHPGERMGLWLVLSYLQPQDVSVSFCRQKVLEQVQLCCDDRMLSAPLSWNSWAECCLPVTEGKKIMSHY